MKHTTQKWTPTLPPFAKNKTEIFQTIGETGQFIYQIGEHRFLRLPSHPVPQKAIKTEIFQQKVRYLKDCLLRYRQITGVGRGITALQVGIPERFSVIYMPENQEQLLIIINPVIIESSQRLFSYPEICMSASPIIAPVTRPSWISFSYLDESGNQQKWEEKDETKNGKMYNRVFQHEIDHMDGIINIDRVESKQLIFESDPTYYDTATFEEVTG